MKKSVTSFVLVLLIGLIASQAYGEDTRSLSMQAVSNGTSLPTSSSNATNGDSLAPSSGTDPKPMLAKSAPDTSDLKQLPPRTLPLGKQMMFAGGFMVFLAIMLTSMQNFNPND